MSAANPLPSDAQPDNLIGSVQLMGFSGGVVRFEVEPYGERSFVVERTLDDFRSLSRHLQGKFELPPLPAKSFMDVRARLTQKTTLRFAASFMQSLLQSDPELEDPTVRRFLALKPVPAAEGDGSTIVNATSSGSYPTVSTSTVAPSPVNTMHSAAAEPPRPAQPPSTDTALQPAMPSAPLDMAPPRMVRSDTFRFVEKKVEEGPEVDAQRMVRSEPGCSLPPRSSLCSNSLVDADLGSPDEGIFRNPELVRLTGNHPLNCEAPMLSFDFQPMMPSDLCFVRNHGPVARVPEPEWSLTVVNQKGERTVISAAQLKSMPKERLMCSPICAGNRRMELNTMKQTKGFNWTTGAWFTATFTGVHLSVVLKHCNVTADPEKNEFIEFMSAETLPEGPYETCLRMGHALDIRHDVLLAFEHNDEPLTPDHGFPVRVVVPGNVGGRWVKWLKEIRVIEGESTKFYHTHDNKVLPPYVDATTPDIESFFADPAYTCWDFPVNSFILEPRHGSIVPLVPSVEDAGQDRIVPLKGITYAGGGRMITRVELSFNGGKTWRPCSVTYPVPPRHGGEKYWCVAFWEPLKPVATLELFTGSVTEIIVRAFDNTMNTQPEHPTWNFLGHCNNCWYRIKVHTRIARDDHPAYQFQHPVSQRHVTNIGGDTGWMSVGKAKDQRLLNRASSRPQLPPIPKEEVKKHNTYSDAWMIINDVVYDVTEYCRIGKHPGGNAALSPFFGLDCTEAFNAVGHSAAAEPDLKKCAIGVVGEKSIVGKKGSQYAYSFVPTGPVLKKRETKEFAIVFKEVLNKSGVLFRMDLEGPEGSSDLADTAIGQHFMLYNGAVSRAYTPVDVRRNGDRVLFELLIKVYPDGELSPWLAERKVGDKVQVSGPSGLVKYGMNAAEHGHFSLHFGPYIKVKKVAMLAAGTGITPMLQLLRYLHQKAEGDAAAVPHEISLIYSARDEDEVMVRDEIEDYERKGLIRLKLLVTNGKRRVDLQWVSSICGRGTEDSIGLVCGPDGFCETMRDMLDKQLGYGYVAVY